MKNFGGQARCVNKGDVEMANISIICNVIAAIKKIVYITSVKKTGVTREK